jgi:iron complex transport system substrate-binding protein
MKHAPHLVNLILASLLLGGCSRADSGHDDGTTTGSSDSLTQTYVDDLERTVRVPREVERIVSLAPACTETLFAVGAGEKVVGVTSFSNFPPEALSVTQVGGLTRETVSLERILQLRPDVVFAAGTLQYELIQDLTQLGLAVIAFEPHDIDGIVANLRLAGEITGTSAQAVDVIADLQRQVEEVVRRVDSIPDEERPAVFYEVWHRPLRTASAASYLGQLVHIAGGRNLFHDLSEPYPLVSEEAVVQRNPEVILAPLTPASDLDEFLRRPGWRNITAVREKQIRFLDEDLVSRPGPRVAQGLWAIGAALHPDRFSDSAPAKNQSPVNVEGSDP